MITRKTKDIPTTTHTFLVTVELIDENDVERIALRLADSLAWVEDVGYVDVKYEGSLDKTRPSKTVWRENNGTETDTSTSKESSANFEGRPKVTGD